jgi:hypothetical protein
MNIYYDSNYASQSSLPTTATFQSITTNGLIIPAANNGDILIADSNHEVDGVAIGPVNYVLQSNGTIPQWTNAITMNTVSSVEYIIPGTSHGDLLTVNGSSALERVPIGTAGSYLISTGSEFQWNANQFYSNTGSSNNIPQNSTPIASTSSLSVVNGFRYRLQITGKLITQVSVALSFSLAATTIDTYTFDNSQGILINYIFTASSTGPILITLAGLTGVVTTASLFNIYFTLELF